MLHPATLFRSCLRNEQADKSDLAIVIGYIDHQYRQVQNLKQSRADYACLKRKTNEKTKSEEKIE